MKGEVLLVVLVVLGALFDEIDCRGARGLAVFAVVVVAGASDARLVFFNGALFGSLVIAVVVCRGEAFFEFGCLFGVKGVLGCWGVTGDVGFFAAVGAFDDGLLEAASFDVEMGPGRALAALSLVSAVLLAAAPLLAAPVWLGCLISAAFP